MASIKQIKAREILDSRGNPTIEVDVTLDNNIRGRAAVPSGASTGAHEAHELRDGDANRYKSKGVQKAVANVIEQLTPAVIGMDIDKLDEIDEKLLSTDGSKNKKNMGANSILGVSLACAQTAALNSGKMLYEYLGGTEATKLPAPLMNVLNGGAHANNSLDVQEFMLVPVGFTQFKDALRAGSEIFQTLKTLLQKKGLSTAVGDEGGFAPNLKSNKEAMELLSEATEAAGYKLGEQIVFALDVAATELYKDGQYLWEGRQISSTELGEIYGQWAKEYPLTSVEDGFSEDDWDGWKSFTKQYGDRLQLVGDDLFVTNPERLKRGIDEKAANALLVKVNQIGSLLETKQAVHMAQEANFSTVMSHRSGETEDTTIADLAVALGCEQIKTGSLCRSERTAKYNQLLRIEEDLGSRAGLGA